MAMASSATATSGLGKRIIGASMSEPHTSESAERFLLYYYLCFVRSKIVVFTCDDHLAAQHNDMSHHIY